MAQTREFTFYLTVEFLHLQKRKDKKRISENGGSEVPSSVQWLHFRSWLRHRRWLRSLFLSSLAIDVAKATWSDQTSTDLDKNWRNSGFDTRLRVIIIWLLWCIIISHSSLINSLISRLIRFQVLKFQLFSLTSIPPDEQRVSSPSLLSVSVCA